MSHYSGTSEKENLNEAVADQGFGKGGFMRMCIVATTPHLMHIRIDAIKVSAADLTASNCRETVSLFSNYTSSKGGFNGNCGNPSGSTTVKGTKEKISMHFRGL